MQISRKITNNFIILFISRLLSSVLNIFVAILLARYLGVEAYGKFSFIFAYLFLFQFLTGAGLDTIVIKEISKNNSKQNIIMGNALILKFVLYFVAIIVSWAVLQFIGYQTEIKYLVYMASIGFLFTFGVLYEGLFQAHYKSGYYAVSQLIVTSILSFLILTMIYLKASLGVFVFIQAYSSLPLIVLYIFFSRMNYGFKHNFRFDFNICKLLIGGAWPIFLSSIFISLNTRMDQILLFNISGEKALGLYAAIVRLTESLNIIPIVFMASIFPLLSFNFINDRDKYLKAYKLSFKYMSTIIIPIAFGVSILSHRLLLLIYGNTFAQASSVFSILIWSEIFVFFGVINSSTFIAADLQKYVLLFTAIGAISNIILNLFLIPHYNIAGAAMATLISYSGFGLLLQLLIKKTHQIAREFVFSTFKPILCSVLMVVFICVFYPLNIFVLIFLSGIVYFLSLVLIKGLDEQDMNYLFQVLKREKV